MRSSIAAIVLTALMLAWPARGDAAGDAAADVALQLRLKNLESELRCLVCQNQTLADSNASLADDLRREVREQVAQGKSDTEIKAYLVARYGDFVLYRPPLKPLTWLLWGGPFALLLGGLLAWWTILRRRAAPGTLDAPRDPGELARGAALLQENSDPAVMSRRS